jgi:MFS family permease
MTEPTARPVSLVAAAAEPDAASAAESSANPETDRSYRALLRVPGLMRILVGMSLARIAGGMVSVTAILFTLTTYHSPALAGLVTFAGTAPGLLVSPIAGALLDRHGRSRLVVLDYLLGAVALTLIAILASANQLPAWLLICIAAVSSLTNPLSNTGLRSLFPMIVPQHLWERGNAVDANGYVVATLIGPPLAAALVQVWGGPPAFLVVAAVFAAAAIVLIHIPDPRSSTASSGGLLADAWRGLVYTVRNPTLRGLGLAMTSLNVGSGMITIIIPIIILDRLQLGPAVVGFAWAFSAVCGMVAAFSFGRRDSRGRERKWLALSMVGYAAGSALFLPTPALPLLLLAMGISGFVSGPLDIALFTVRQRRTDPAWMGRAFAVSMSFNFAGFPIGSALGGWLVGQSIELAVVIAVIVALVAAATAWILIPAEAEPGAGLPGPRRSANLG